MGNEDGGGQNRALSGQQTLLLWTRVVAVNMDLKNIQEVVFFLILTQGYVFIYLRERETDARKFHWLATSHTHRNQGLNPQTKCGPDQELNP